MISKGGIGFGYMKRGKEEERKREFELENEWESWKISPDTTHFKNQI